MFRAHKLKSPVGKNVFFFCGKFLDIAFFFFSTGDLKTGDNEIYYDYVIETKASNVKQDILDVIDPLM